VLFGKTERVLVAQIGLSIYLLPTQRHLLLEALLW
jgi:hypothetical protein